MNPLRARLNGVARLGENVPIAKPEDAAIRYPEETRCS